MQTKAEAKCVLGQRELALSIRGQVKGRPVVTAVNGRDRDVVRHGALQKTLMTVGICNPQSGTESCYEEAS